MNVSALILITNIECLALTGSFLTFMVTRRIPLKYHGYHFRISVKICRSERQCVSLIRMVLAECSRLSMRLTEWNRHDLQSTSYLARGGSAMQILDFVTSLGFGPLLRQWHVSTQTFFVMNYNHLLQLCSHHYRNNLQGRGYLSTMTTLPVVGQCLTRAAESVQHRPRGSWGSLVLALIHTRSVSIYTGVRDRVFHYMGPLPVHSAMVPHLVRVLLTHLTITAAESAICNRSYALSLPYLRLPPIALGRGPRGRAALQ